MESISRRQNHPSTGSNYRRVEQHAFRKSGEGAPGRRSARARRCRVGSASSVHEAETSSLVRLALVWYRDGSKGFQ